MTDMFLALTGVTGEAQAEEHKGEILIQEWVWSLSNRATYQINRADTVQQTHVDHMTIHKFFDSASVTLINYCATGTHIPKGTISCAKNSPYDYNPTVKTDFLLIELEDIKVELVKWEGRGAETVMIPELVELSFRKFTVKYAIQNAEGFMGAWNEFPFDIPQQKGQPTKPGR